MLSRRIAARAQFNDQRDAISSDFRNYAYALG